MKWSAENREMALRDGGMTALGCLVVLVFLAVLGFVGYKVGDAYWTYYQVREQVRQSLTWAVAGQAKEEAAIVQKTITYVASTGLRLKPRNVRITQSPEHLTLTVFWTHDLEFPYYTYPLDFEVKLSDVKRWGRGGLVVR